MQIVPVQGVAQPAPTVAPAVVPLAGPAAPAAPIEPARRVTANREGGRGDLQTQQQAQKAPPAQTRGRLIDLSV
ncbi:MAG: hypothetical protein ACLQJR_10810 [Stellaceae bacterium]